MISTKERAYLRGLAQKMEPVVQVGKGGITEQVIQSILSAFNTRELIKVRLLQNSLLGTKEAMEQICSGTGADPVQQIGSVVVVYKRNEDKNFKHVL